MADQIENGTDIKIVAPQKGLFVDSSKEQQPKGTYSFALNAVDESAEGDIFALSNESSNERFAVVASTYFLLGSVYLEDNNSVLFYYDEATSNSIIAHLDKIGSLTELVVSDCLGFDINYQIEGTFRIKNGCERIVYFVDHNNPDRVVNLDRLDLFLKEGYSLTDTSVSKWDCSQFNIDRIAEPVCITLDSVHETGGSIPAGTIQLTIQLLDENLNGSGWCDPTNTIPIIDDSYEVSYPDIDGAPFDRLTNKSIRILVENIDTNYEYLQIGAVITNDGVSQSYVIENVPIKGSSMFYTFKGILSDSIQTDILFSRDTYSSKSIAQLENRLIRANLKTTQRDYTGLQRNYANNITTKYITYEIDADSQVESSKSPYHYFNNRSYMRDEIYAFGIYYIYTDGTKSPVFHIPGREKDTGLPTNSDPNNSLGLTHSRPAANGAWDSTIYNIVAQGSQNYISSIAVDEVRHLGLAVDDTVERWQVYNTAIKDTSGISTGISTGIMAYHECETDYPTTVDCDGNYIYGSLAGTPIRHHRFPDATLEPHYQNDNIYPMGVRFDNVILPPDTIGFKIVRCDRDDLNKTVLDKGIAHYTRTAAVDGVNLNFQAPFMNRHLTESAVHGDDVVPDGSEAGAILAGGGSLTTKTGKNKSRLTYHSALQKFKPTAISPTHIKTELSFRGETSHASGNFIQEDEYNTSIQYIYDTSYTIRRNSRTNVKIDKFAYVGANSIERTALTDKFVNNYQSETLALELATESYIIDFANNDIDNLSDSFVRLGVSLYKVDYCGYFSIKNSKRDVYANLDTLEYYPIHECTETSPLGNFIIAFGGDIFISRMDYKHTFRSYSDDASDRPNLSSPPYLFTDGEDPKHNYTHIVSFWGESEINSELRHEVTNQTYYPKSHQTYTELKNEFLEPSLEDGDYIPNYYNYNFDFSKYNTAAAYIPLPATWNYCSNCLNIFPNRIIYSEQSFQEEVADNYLTTLVNNYKDINGNRGEITKIYNYKNTIVVDCEESRFVLPSTSKAIQASEENIYIGTGEFFSLPVQEIVDSNVGYLGNQHQWASKITENGIFTVDSRSGNIFLYNKGIENLASVKFGMSNYFREHLSIELPKQYQELRGSEVIKDNPANPYNGVGYTSIYDTRHDRFILTKHDFRLTEAGENLVQASTGTERLDYLEDGWHYISLGANVLIKPIDYPEWFENTSWTMSFSMKRNAWISWHSYIPTNYIDFKLGFGSVSNGRGSAYSGVWRHNKKFEYQTFYGTYFPHIIEFVESSNPVETRTYNSVNFITKAKQWDNTNKYFVDKRLITFDKAILYNNYQCSGLINLLVKRNQTSFDRDFESWDQQALLDINERTYSFNEFRDLVGDYDVPLFTKDWSNTDYQTDYFIDKIINPSSINLNKDWWEQDVFRGKHLTLRLFFSILDNVKLTTQFQLFETGTTQR